MYGALILSIFNMKKPLYCNGYYVYKAVLRFAFVFRTTWYINRTLHGIISILHGLPFAFFSSNKFFHKEDPGSAKIKRVARSDKTVDRIMNASSLCVRKFKSLAILGNKSGCVTWSEIPLTRFRYH